VLEPTVRVRPPHVHNSESAVGVALLERKQLRRCLVSDHVTLVFADGTEYAIEVKDGEADATAKAIIDGSGDYSTGWLSRDDRHLLNLGSIVRIEIRRASDPGPSVEFLR